MMKKIGCGRVWTNILCGLTPSTASKLWPMGQNKRKYDCIHNETATASYSNLTPHILVRPATNHSQIDPVVTGQAFLLSNPRIIEDSQFHEQCQRGRWPHPGLCRLLGRPNMVKARNTLLTLSACRR